MGAKGSDAAPTPDSWRQAVAARTAADVGAPVELLGVFLDDLDAAAAGHALDLPHIDRYLALGREGAQRGLPVRTLVDLYLTAARQAWPRLTAVVDERDVVGLNRVGSAVLAAIDDVVAAVCEGFEDARRTASRAEESLRREFVDDLLIGTSRHSQLVEHASAFGLRLESAHTVLVVSGSRRFLDHRVMVRDVEAALLDRIGRPAAEANLLVATRSGLLVVVVPAELEGAARVTAERLRREPSLSWRLAVSRTRTGATGVRVSFEEACSALDLAERLQLADPVVKAEDLLVYEVLTRDREMMVELVDAVLAPLQAARGGAEPLLHTLRVYFGCGGVAVAAAKRLHLSVRAVTYRLDRVTALTDRDPQDPDDRFVLDAALRGALVLGWPEVPLGPVRPGSPHLRRVAAEDRH